MANLGTLTLDLVARIGGFTGALDKAGRESKRHMSTIEKSAQSASIAIGSMVSVGAIAAFTSSLIKTSLEMQKMERLFNAAAGSASLGGRELEYVREVSERLGLELASTGTAYGKFMAAIRGSSIEGEQGRKVFESVSAAATALGLSADETHGMFNALQQMMSKGKVQAEELRGQLGERLPGALNMAAKAMGVTTAELNKMMEDGKLFADELLPKLAIELDNTYGVAAKEGAKSAAAEINRFNNAMLETKSVAGKALLPVFTDILKAVNPVILSLVKVTQAVQILGIRLAANAEKREVFGKNIMSGIGAFSTEGLAKQKAAADAADKLADEMIENILKGSNASTSAYTKQEEAVQRLLKSTPKLTKAIKEQKNPIDEQIKALQKQLEVFGMTETESKLWELDTKGATKAQFENAEAILNKIDALKKDKEAQDEVTQNLKDYQALVRDLRTDEEKYNDLLEERLATMEKVGKVPDADMAARIVGSGVTKAPSFGGTAFEVGGINGEVAKIDQFAAELNAWEESELKKQEKFQEFKDVESEIYKAAEEEKTRITEEAEAKREALRKQRSAAVTQGLWETVQNEAQIMSNAFAIMGQMTENFAGKNSAAYKAIFAMQQIFAAAMIIANTEIAASKAPAELTVLGGLAAATVIRATGYASAGMVAGMGLAGMAHDGMESIPQDGTWLLKKGERVSTAETSAKLDKTLDDVSKQSSGGDAPIINLFEDKSKAGTVETRQQDDKRVIDIWVADLMGDGKAQKAMSRKFGLQPVGA